jgi:hypothetical protein
MNTSYRARQEARNTSTEDRLRALNLARRADEPATPSPSTTASASQTSGPDPAVLASLQLFTLAHAAELLAVPEAWLASKAGRREIPSTQIGKHLRFSVADITAIIREGARPALPASESSPTERPHPR